jgi:hypothetical protein
MAAADLPSSRPSAFEQASRIEQTATSERAILLPGRPESVYDHAGTPVDNRPGTMPGRRRRTHSAA